MFLKLISVLLAAAWSSGGVLNPAPRFSSIPPVEAGESLYAVGLDLDVSGTLTNPTGGNITPGTAAQIALINRVTIQPTNAPRAMVNAKGINLARLYRLEHKGKRPAQWASTGLIASGGGTAAVSFTLPVRFGPSSALRPEDFAVPLSAFGDSSITVQFGTGDDVSTGLTFAGTVTATPIVVSMPAIEAPTFCVVDEIEVSAGTTQPEIPITSGRLVVFATGRRGGVFATTEQVTAGLNVGAQIISNTQTTAKVFYRSYNEEADAVTDLQDHTAAAAALDDSFPIVRPNPLDGSNKISRLVKLDGQKPVLVVGTATNNYDIIRRWIPGAAEQSTWCQLVAATSGLPVMAFESDRAKTVTNSHKPTGSPELVSLLPAKIV